MCRSLERRRTINPDDIEYLPLSRPRREKCDFRYSSFEGDFDDCDKEIENSEHVASIFK